MQYRKKRSKKKKKVLEKSLTHDQTITRQVQRISLESQYYDNFKLESIDSKKEHEDQTFVPKITAVDSQKGKKIVNSDDDVSSLEEEKMDEVKKVEVNTYKPKLIPKINSNHKSDINSDDEDSENDLKIIESNLTYKPQPQIQKPMTQKNDDDQSSSFGEEIIKEKNSDDESGSNLSPSPKKPKPN